VQDLQLNYTPIFCFLEEKGKLKYYYYKMMFGFFAGDLA